MTYNNPRQIARRYADMHLDSKIPLSHIIELAIIESGGAGSRNGHVGLTGKQRDLLNFIKAYSDENECSPSYDEMRLAMGLRSKSGIHRLLHALAERGAVALMPNRARSIVVRRS